MFRNNDAIDVVCLLGLSFGARLRFYYSLELINLGIRYCLLTSSIVATQYALVLYIKLLCDYSGEIVRDAVFTWYGNTSFGMGGLRPIVDSSVNTRTVWLSKSCSTIF